MIIKFDEYIKESLRNKMTGKSKEEIYKTLGMSDEREKKYMKHIWPITKKIIEDKFPDSEFNKDSTLYRDTYYITDRYDDENNLYKIMNIINEYGIISSTSSYNGHSAIKINVLK